MKLLWILKAWVPNVYTFSAHDTQHPGFLSGVLVGFDAVTDVPTSFASSHAAAAAWAGEQIGKSLDSFARGVGACAICGRLAVEGHDRGAHYLATIKGGA